MQSHIYLYYHLKSRVIPWESFSTEFDTMGQFLLQSIVKLPSTLLIVSNPGSTEYCHTADLHYVNNYIIFHCFPMLNVEH